MPSGISLTGVGPTGVGASGIVPRGGKPAGILMSDRVGGLGVSGSLERVCYYSREIKSVRLT